MSFKSSVIFAAALASLLAVGTASAKEVISTKDAPAAIGPYSQAIRVSAGAETLYLAGQIAIDPKTNQLSKGTIEEQTTLVLENIKGVLAAAGMTMDNVVSTTVFVKDIAEFGKMNAVYATYFKDGKPPARATVQAAALPRDVAVEISVIAAKKP